MTAPSPRSRTFKRRALLLIVLLAAFLRFYRIGELPPGDGYDPAWYGVDALDILKGNLPVYLPTNIGREALFSYIVALCVAITGIGPHAIHLASALVGTLTVPATFLVADILMCQERRAWLAAPQCGSPHAPTREERSYLSNYGGLLSALVIAVSHWHLHWSRYGVRAILVPLFTSLSLWALTHLIDARARAHTPIRKRRFAVLTGVLLGLSLYTYQSARLLPALIVAVYVLETTQQRTWTKRAWTNLAIIAGVCALVFAPMGLYLIRNPGVGNERIGQTMAISRELSLEENGQRVWAEVVDAARVIAIEGDNEIIHNLPGRPATNPFLIALALLGFGISLTRIIRWPYWLLPAWLLAMSITVFVTVGGQPTKRALGALPAIAMLVAVGGLAPLDWLSRRRHTRWYGASRVVTIAWIALLTGGLTYSAGATYRDYFITWANDPDLWTHFEGGRVAIGQYARTLPADEVIYSSPEMPDHPSIVYNSGGRAGMKGYNGRLCTVVPAVTEAPTTYIIVQHDERQSLDRLAAIFPHGETIAAGPNYYGQPYFTAYRIPVGERARVSIQYNAAADFSSASTVGAADSVGAADCVSAIRFMGYDASANELKQGETLQLTLYSKALAPIQQDYVLFVHLLGPDNPATGNTLWAQDDSAPCRGFYPTTVWSPQEIIIDTYTLHIPENTPAGPYELQVGFYTWPDFQHLTTTNGPDGTQQTTFSIGSVDVSSP